VIILSIWNSISIPYELAFPDAFEGLLSFIIIDYFIDILFAFDILINFRSVYKDSKTEENVVDGRKIAFNYACKGRFFIDLLASMPFEIFGLIFNASSSQLKLFGMLKLVRLLRLGRMITYLKANRSFKFGAKLIQLLFMLILVIHWIACLWYAVTLQDISWFPAKDLDAKFTIIF